MELQEIKQRLPLAEVLAYYGLKPDKHHRLHCPFHADKTPSLQVYYKTHTAYCFSSNCRTHGRSMDVIDFIMHKEQLTKAEAIQKAKSLITQPQAAANPAQSRGQFLGNLFTYFRNGLHNSKPAQAYAQQRGLDHTKIEIGYNSGQFHHGSRRDDQLITRSVELGLLQPLDRLGRTGEAIYKPFAKSCLCFALRNEAGGISGLYFRSTINDQDANASAGSAPGRHFYLKDRKGLYPYYPDPQTEKLIVTESVIDAASLLQIKEIASGYGIIAAYGTNGLTEEHQKAIAQLTALQEVIFAFDRDDAGRAATNKYAAQLRSAHPHISCSTLELPNKDVNETLLAHTPEIFMHLLSYRKPIGRESFSFYGQDLPFSTEPSTEKTTEALATGIPTPSTEKLPSPATVIPAADEKKTSVPIVTPSPSSTPVLETANPHKLICRTATAVYYILGGVPPQLDSLKLTLAIEHPQTGHKSRHKADLYEDRQTEKLVREASEKLHLDTDTLHQDISRLTDLLAGYREQQQQEKQPTQIQPAYHLTEQERKAALQVLQQKDLLPTLNNLLGQCGITGEENNRLLLLLIAISYKTKEPLHGLIQGSSGSGKTRLQQQVSDCIPPEDVLRFTRVTESSLYNYPEHFLSNKLLCFEDIDGLKEEAQLAVRELISNGQLTSSTSTKNEAGQIQSQIRTVKGPVASLACTTRGAIYEDNMSRVFLVAVDESQPQTQRIISYQNKKAAGRINHRQEQQAKEKLQHLIRLLHPKGVINPYAEKVCLPKEAHKIRRLNELFQSFIRMVTLVHQYQRKTDSEGRLIAEVQDIRQATDILFESIILKVDELDGSLRQFYEQLKAYLQKRHEHSEKAMFTQREIRQALKISRTQLYRYTTDLLQLEYLHHAGGHANRGYSYRLSYWDDYGALRNRVKTELQKQLDSLPINKTGASPPPAKPHHTPV